MLFAPPYRFLGTDRPACWSSQTSPGRIRTDPIRTRHSSFSRERFGDGVGPARASESAGIGTTLHLGQTGPAPGLRTRKLELPLCPEGGRARTRRMPDPCTSPVIRDGSKNPRITARHCQLVRNCAESWNCWLPKRLEPWNRIAPGSWLRSRWGPGIDGQRAAGGGRGYRCKRLVETIWAHLAQFSPSIWDRGSGLWRCSGESPFERCQPPARL